MCTLAKLQTYTLYIKIKLCITVNNGTSHILIQFCYFSCTSLWQKNVLHLTSFILHMPRLLYHLFIVDYIFNFLRLGLIIDIE